jgi:hypothetical protein
MATSTVPEGCRAGTFEGPDTVTALAQYDTGTKHELSPAKKGRIPTGVGEDPPTRPLHFFRPDGPMPDALELPLTLPAELGPAAAVLSELRDRVRAVELERAAERARTGGRVLGRRAVRAQSWRDSPTSVEPRRNLRPRVATRSQWARIEALLRNRAFAVEYASARERWRDGLPAVFPPGTYWLHRFAAVPVLET